MKALLKGAGLTALVVAALLLWQRHGPAVALADAMWLCVGG